MTGPVLAVSLPASGRWTDARDFLIIIVLTALIVGGYAAIRHRSDHMSRHQLRKMEREYRRGRR